MGRSDAAKRTTRTGSQRVATSAARPSWPNRGSSSATIANRCCHIRVAGPRRIRLQTQHELIFHAKNVARRRKIQTRLRQTARLAPLHQIAALRHIDEQTITVIFALDSGVKTMINALVKKTLPGRVKTLAVRGPKIGFIRVKLAPASTCLTVSLSQISRARCCPRSAR